jgi:hypothetical protein
MATITENLSVDNKKIKSLNEFNLINFRKRQKAFAGIIRWKHTIGESSWSIGAPI